MGCIDSFLSSPLLTFFTRAGPFFETHAGAPSRILNYTNAPGHCAEERSQCSLRHAGAVACVSLLMLPSCNSPLLFVSLDESCCRLTESCCRLDGCIHKITSGMELEQLGTGESESSDTTWMQSWGKLGGPRNQTGPHGRSFAGSGLLGQGLLCCPQASFFG